MNEKRAQKKKKARTAESLKETKEKKWKKKDTEVTIKTNNNINKRDTLKNNKNAALNWCLSERISCLFLHKNTSDVFWLTSQESGAVFQIKSYVYSSPPTPPPPTPHPHPSSHLRTESFADECSNYVCLWKRSLFI